MDIVVHVNRDGQTAANANVTLKMSEVKNNGDHWIYEIKVNIARLSLGEITVSGNTKPGKNWDASQSAKTKTKSLDGHATQTYLARACLKNALCQLHAPLCGQSVPNEGA